MFAVTNPLKYFDRLKTCVFSIARMLQNVSFSSTVSSLNVVAAVLNICGILQNDSLSEILMLAYILDFSESMKQTGMIVT